MALHHHIGDVLSNPFSPIYAFSFTRLRFGVTPQERWVGRVTPCAPTDRSTQRRARIDALCSDSSRHLHWISSSNRCCFASPSLRLNSILPAASASKEPTFRPPHCRL